MFILLRLREVKGLPRGNSWLVGLGSELEPNAKNHRQAITCYLYSVLEC